jgi:hypothetical protein
MKKLLIAVVTLTVMAAHATNWTNVQNMKIVNNTSDPIVVRTEPDSLMFTLQPGQSQYAANQGDTSLYFGWGVQSSGPDLENHVVLTQSFDDNSQTGTMSTTSVAISGNIGYGQAWHIGNIGYDDTLVLTGPNSSSSNIQLTATRLRGVNIERSGGNLTDNADVFCLNTGVMFTLQYYGGEGRCPIGETQVVMADQSDVLNDNTLDYWTPSLLINNISTICDFVFSCSAGPQGYTLTGTYMYDFGQFQYSADTSILHLAL